MASRFPSHVRITLPLDPRRRKALLYRRLALAGLLSIVLHLAGGMWIEYQPWSIDQSPPLTAELRALPPPPLPQAPRPKPKPRPKPAKRPPAPQTVTAPEPEAAFSPQPPGLLPAEEPAKNAPEKAPAAAEPAPPPPPQEVAKAPEPPQIPLPERIEIVYAALYGTVGVYVGDASYRFEYHDGRYRIETTGEAQGLIALFYRGVLRAVSEGRITSAGLQPDTVFIERGSADKRETARLDWEKKIVTFKDDTTAPLESGTQDLLSFMLQFYFLPPTDKRLQLPVVTPRRKVVYTFEWQGVERIHIPLGDFDGERWSRSSDQTQGVQAMIWLAPEFGHMPVRIRMRDPERGTAELRLARVLTDPRKP